MSVSSFSKNRGVTPLTFSLPLAPIIGTGCHHEIDNEASLCAFDMPPVCGKDYVEQITYIRKDGTQIIALIRPYFVLFVGASHDDAKIITNNQNKAR